MEREAGPVLRAGARPDRPEPRVAGASEEGLHERATDSTTPTGRGDVDGMLHDSRVTGAGRGPAERRPADHAAVLDRDEAVSAEPSPAELLPGGRRRLEGRIAGRDPLRADCRDRGPVRVRELADLEGGAQSTLAGMERWATFDCYGTLVDWNAGIRRELVRLFGVARAEELLARYHEMEPEIQAAQPGASYRQVLTIALERLEVETGLSVPEGEASALARSLPHWPVFDDVPTGLARVREHGWLLAVLSNTDRDLIDASLEAIGVPFDVAIVAGEIGSYKPASRHWEVFREQTDADPAGWVHVAQSLYHDIAPATAIGLRTIWINRVGEPADPRPTRTLPSVADLAEALDELVPAGA